jgi:hypothetical protein
MMPSNPSSVESTTEEDSITLSIFSEVMMDWAIAACDQLQIMKPLNSFSSEIFTNIEREFNKKNESV